MRIGPAAELLKCGMAKKPSQPTHPLRTVRADTLIRLRWFAIAGQTAAVLFVRYGLDYDLPLAAAATVIVVSAWLNLALRLRYGITPRLEPEQAAWLLAFDLVQLTALLYLTGGVDNPFSFMLLAPVVISATALPPRITMALGGFAVLCATGLIFLHYPLPWASDEKLDLPALYTMANWASLLIALGFTGVYAWQISEETRLLADALTATELALAREHHLSQLDGLAAAAAHELATPLSTITVIAKELERSLPPDSPYAEDIHLLREQAQRCRDILGKLTELDASGAPFDTMKLSALLEEVSAPHRNFGIDIEIALPGDRTHEPASTRNPAILYGLGNLIENAVDFAKSRVEVAARWSDQEVVITIADDGPGFSPEIKDHLGDPYVTSRRRKPEPTDAEPSGLGLGVFIAKTLLERSGATLALANQGPPDTGAVVRIRWSRADFERPLAPS
jgi:two-component system sensor histidine kinase RegB